MVPLQASCTLPRLALGDKPWDLGAGVCGWLLPTSSTPGTSTDMTTLVCNHLFRCRALGRKINGNQTERI